MSLILVAEDDFGTRKLLSVILERSGYDVRQASHGPQAWEMACALRPDVIVSDINMPGMTGIELLARVRAHPDFGLTPVVLITSLQERHDVRLGMSLGADDYIGKPVSPEELLAAVAAQVNRNTTRAAVQDIQVREAVGSALKDQARRLGDNYEQRLAEALSEQWPGSRQGRHAGVLPDATVLCVRLVPAQVWTRQLGPQTMARVLGRFHECVGDTVFLFGAWHLHGCGTQLLAVFADNPDQPGVPHALRAYRAALAMRQAEATLDAFAASLRGDTERVDLPAASLSIGMQCGPVAMAELQGLLGGEAQTAPVGLPVLEAEVLAQHGPRAPHRMAVSPPMMRRVAGAARQVERRLLEIEGWAGPMDVCVIEPAI
ncbi:MAG TPA: response regulator [Hydrogenophaga sp.]|uniref:response regulator n=1 Tax=Hydrogenophaga sp. TaxID=1904254 RepID=UPI002C615C57|nr:response regulator [Hydrogenophaga sp.]HMN92947.1 response regulator [Hydrogenophaga sp.]HMP09750.1 response regulator [Hydrogenophaga sp.]